MPVPVAASTTAATPPNAPASPSPTAKGTCASCSLYLPPNLVTPGVAPCLKTSDGDVTYVSLRHPTSQERYKAVRSACIRALSTELVPGRSGPVFFGDPSIGYTIAYIFRLSDSATASVNSHDARRQYALMCTTTEEQDLLQSWTFITERFRVLAQRITEGSKAELDKQAYGKDPATPTATATSHKTGGGQVTPSIDRDRSFLRPKGRAAEKGLAELSGMEDIFVQLHASFAWLLGIWRVHFEGRPSTAQMPL